MLSDFSNSYLFIEYLFKLINFLYTFFVFNQRKVLNNNLEKQIIFFFLPSSLPSFLFYSIFHLADSESSGNRYGKMDENVK